MDKNFFFSQLRYLKNRPSVSRALTSPHHPGVISLRHWGTYVPHIPGAPAAPSPKGPQLPCPSPIPASKLS